MYGTLVGGWVGLDASAADKATFGGSASERVCNLARACSPPTTLDKATFELSVINAVYALLAATFFSDYLDKGTFEWLASKLVFVFLAINDWLRPS